MAAGGVSTAMKQSLHHEGKHGSLRLWMAVVLLDHVIDRANPKRQAAVPHLKKGLVFGCWGFGFLLQQCQHLHVQQFLLVGQGGGVVEQNGRR